MLFLSLLVYLIIWIPFTVFLVPVMKIQPVKIWISMPILFGVAFLIVCLLIYLVHNFNPEKKGFIRGMLNTKGVRWIILATAITGVVSLAFIVFNKTGGHSLFGILLPIIALSALNVLKIEIIPKSLVEEQVEIIKQEDSTIVKEDAEEDETETADEEDETGKNEYDYRKKFTWDHKGKSYDIEIVIRKAIYELYKSKERLPCCENWASEYVAGGICAEIREIAYRLVRIGKPYGTYEEVEFVISFIQNAIVYGYDKDTKGEVEYPRYPVESLVDGVGDCEDFTILGASILKSMGYDVALILFSRHVALGISGAEGIPGAFKEHEGKQYYYCEMTSNGWKIGQVPEGYDLQESKVYPVKDLIVKIDEPVDK